MSSATHDHDIELACYAARERDSRGRIYDEPAHKYRGEYQRDRDRVIHSTAFRRLIYKTQVFVNHEGDLYRTRLTHSLEVAQIARTVARELRLNEQLAEAICLAHDLGHTPFGHAGQDALNKCMQEFGGFEHNLQSLRVVDELEEKYAAFPGLNLSFETREGILKHCSRKNARDLGEIGERFLQGLQPGMEAQLANLADAIAYNNHDVDDGLRSGLITIDELCSVPMFARNYDQARKLKSGLQGRVLIFETVRGMINYIVTDLLTNTRQALEDARPDSPGAVRELTNPLIVFSPETYAEHQALKQFLQKRLYRHPKVLAMTERAAEVVAGLFDLFMNNSGAMPAEHSFKADVWSGELGDAGRARAVCDYVAGMTDRYALSVYRELVGPTEDI
ncbi:MAG: deoxyguanosinetriphosphate triphosphohydrolase [Gammaproteobacteria bacterium]